jgi:hypothetical protein
LQCDTVEEEKEADDNDGGEYYDFSFLANDETTIAERHMIDQDWILLDSESTVCIFSNRKFLRNIRHCGTKEGLRVHSNGGFQDTHMIGDLPGFGRVWYNKGSLANILSLAPAVCRVCRVTMDSQQEAALVVHKHDGKKMKFTESKKVSTSMTPVKAILSQS